MEENPYQASAAPASGAPASSPPGVALSLPVLFALLVGLPLIIAVGIVLATGTASRFYWLLEQAAAIYPFAWPVSLPLFIFLLVSYRQLSSPELVSDRRLLWLAPLPDIAIAMLVLGAVYAGPRGHEYPQWTMDLTPVGFFAALGVVVLAVVFNRGRRWFVASIGLLLLLGVFSCSLMAGMSITGDWL